VKCPFSNGFVPLEYNVRVSMQQPPAQAGVNDVPPEVDGDFNITRGDDEFNDELNDNFGGGMRQRSDRVGVNVVRQRVGTFTESGSGVDAEMYDDPFNLDCGGGIHQPCNQVGVNVVQQRVGTFMESGSGMDAEMYNPFNLNCGGGIHQPCDRVGVNVVQQRVGTFMEVYGDFNEFDN
jgi:hypothetical protein